MDALDWTEIPGCNAAWTEALTTVEEMVSHVEGDRQLRLMTQLIALM